MKNQEARITRLEKAMENLRNARESAPSKTPVNPGYNLAGILRDWANVTARDGLSADEIHSMAEEMTDISRAVNAGLLTIAPEAHEAETPSPFQPTIDAIAAAITDLTYLDGLPVDLWERLEKTLWALSRIGAELSNRPANPESTLSPKSDSLSEELANASAELGRVDWAGPLSLRLYKMAMELDDDKFRALSTAGEVTKIARMLATCPETAEPAGLLENVALRIRGFALDIKPEFEDLPF